MATIDFSKNSLFSTDNGEFGSFMYSGEGGQVTSHSSTHFTFEFGTAVYKYTGTGLTFSSTYPFLPKAGTITGFELSYNGTSVGKTTGLHDKVADIIKIGHAHDTAASKALLATDLAHADTIKGGYSADFIHARGGNDAVSGGAGRDFLFGDAGNDKLSGGAGGDYLTCGSGNDHFVFNTALDGVNNVDIIFDFKPADDTIDLSHSIFHQAGSAGHTLTTAAFKVFDDASDKLDKSDRILYVKGTGNLFYDADGSGTKYHGIEFATVDGHPALTHNDFHII